MVSVEVSASSTTTSSIGTFQASAVTWANTVSCPWPIGQAPVATTILPEASIFTVAPSNGPTPVPSV